MINSTRRFLVRALAGAGALSIQQTALRADATDRGNDHKLEGAWDIAITLPDGSPTPFRILRTITPTGVVDGYAFPPFTFTPGAVNSSGHGDWKRIGNNAYSATVKYFQLKYLAAPGFGNVIDSIGTVRENIKLSADGNSYTSDFVTTIALPDGTVVATNPGKTVAKRIVVEPLS